MKKRTGRRLLKRHGWRRSVGGCKECPSDYYRKAFDKLMGGSEDQRLKTAASHILGYILYSSEAYEQHAKVPSVTTTTNTIPLLLFCI